MGLEEERQRPVVLIIEPSTKGDEGPSVDQVEHSRGHTQLTQGVGDILGMRMKNAVGTDKFNLEREREREREDKSISVALFYLLSPRLAE